MERICADCGAPTDPSEDFCGDCGTYLEWEERPVEVAAPAPPAEEPAVKSSRGIAERVKSAIGIAEDEEPPAAALLPAEMKPAPVAPSPPPAARSAVAPTPPGAPPGLPPGPPPPRSAPASGKDEQTAAAMVVQVPVAKPAPEAPAPVKPGAAAPRPRRRPVTRDREPINPGDLVCGECGAGNKPNRKFCRRCGHDLKEAAVLKVPWWRRLLTRKPKAGREAGSRPRQRQAQRLRMPNRSVAFLLLAVLLGGGGYAGRGFVMSAVDTVRDRVSGTTRINPDSMAASSFQPGHQPYFARNGTPNEYWAPAEPGAGVNSYVEAHFDTPFRLVYLNISTGVTREKEAVFLSNGRPSRIKVTVTRDGGPAVVKTIDLEDEMGFQQFRVAASDAISVRLQILGSYKGATGSHTAIGEVEFYRRK